MSGVIDIDTLTTSNHLSWLHLPSLALPHLAPRMQRFFAFRQRSQGLSRASRFICFPGAFPFHSGGVLNLWPVRWNLCCGLPDCAKCSSIEDYTSISKFFCWNFVVAANYFYCFHHYNHKQNPIQDNFVTIIILILTNFIPDNFVLCESTEEPDWSL